MGAAQAARSIKAFARGGKQSPGAVAWRGNLSPMAAVGHRDPWLSRRQRAAIAAVLAGAPDVALLDEPTRGMDDAARDALCAVVTKMRAAGCAIVLATHDKHLVAALADHTVAVGAGSASELTSVAVA